MSYFIANLIKYEEKEDKIYVRGGSNNVVPRSNCLDFYHDKRDLLKDLISGGLDLRSTNKLAEKCKQGKEIIKQRHKKVFGKRQELFQGGVNSSINPFSLYMISSYPSWDKEETLKNMYDTKHTSENFKQRKIEEAIATESIWEEAVSFYKEQEKEFFKFINIPL
jgi:hypothetical protein